MGIKGLTTYINRNKDRFYQSYNLHDCFLVIDGCSLAYNLYNDVSNCYSAFGGDYDKYAIAIKNFFSLLKQCNVIPIVLVDGGYEKRKFRTVISRLRETYSRTARCTPVNQSHVLVYPLMMMVVFKQTLASIGVKFAQADFEGDSEIAAVARYLDCPVLSLDSDFYVYDVKYIPFSSLSLSVSQINIDSKVKHYLSCEVYEIEHFIANCGGLDKSLLPLIAVLLGNDYVPRNVFGQFSCKQGRSIKKKKNMSATQSKIAMIFDWLRQETLSSATIKILNRVKLGKRKALQCLIQQSITGYNYCPTELISYLGLKNQEADLSVLRHAHQFQCVDEFLKNSELAEEIETESSDESECSDGSESSDGTEYSDEAECSDEAACSEESENHLECSEMGYDEVSSVENVRTPSKFPPWLRDKFRRGELPSFVSDIYNFHLYFCKSQMEDFTLDDSQILSFPILQVLCRFLLCNDQGTNENDHNYRITCYLRRSIFKMQKFKLEATCELPCLTYIPPISLLPSLSDSVRKDVLYNTLGFSSADDIELAESFGEKWQLFAMVVVFWARSATNPKVTNCHLQAVIISMLVLGVIDVKIGRVRHQRDITKRKAKNLQRIQQKCANIESGETIQEFSTASSQVPLKDALAKVSEADCWNFAEFVLQCNQINGKLLTNPKQFSPLLVHSLAQLQGCLNQALVLNSILGFPIPQCHISETYSGTITYMAFSNFNARNDVELYVKGQMRNSPSVYDIYSALWVKFKSLLPALTVLFRKSKKKVKVKPKECIVSSASDHDSTSDGEPGPIFDANNRFALLGIA